MKLCEVVGEAMDGNSKDDELDNYKADSGAIGGLAVDQLRSSPEEAGNVKIEDGRVEDILSEAVKQVRRLSKSLCHSHGFPSRLQSLSCLRSICLLC